ncbi:MAG: OBAP family protein [Pseudomonadota bacterium]|nr:OBAP family protein [Pseudomonadota bacterium]
MSRLFVLALFGVACGVACGRGEALEEGADVLQSTKPIEQIDIFVNGFHYASGDMSMQEEANHYCSRKEDGLIQCVLYDGTEPDANMIGIEHIVSREVFDALSADEKALWHPHTYEVKSGALIAPGLPPAAEHELMEMLVSTYGKTWHVWHPGETDLPEGTSTLMKGFYADGQLDPGLLRARDERFGVDAAELARQRADIEDPGFDEVVLEEPRVGVCEDGVGPGPRG